MTFDERGVERAAAVVRGPHVLDLPDAGLAVDRQLHHVRGEAVGPAQIAPQANDTASAKRLWAICEELSKVSFFARERDLQAS